MSTAEPSIVLASTPEQFDAARELMLEYAASLNFKLCFQDFDRELASLGDQYGPPSACMLLLRAGAFWIGCIGARQLEDGICEMKRLYVKPAFRGRGYGRLLVAAAMTNVLELGYGRVRLETAMGMDAAHAIYRSMGFRSIPAYYRSALPGVTCMERELPAGAVT